MAVEIFSNPTKVILIGSGGKKSPFEDFVTEDGERKFDLKLIGRTIALLAKGRFLHSVLPSKHHLIAL